jgi:hypothetical protein
MNKRICSLAGSLILILGLSLEINAQSGSASGYLAAYHIFPEFAGGRLTDGSYYRTTLMISNRCSAPQMSNPS